MAPSWRKKRTSEREREKEMERRTRRDRKNPSSRVPSFKFHDLHFICNSATPPAQKSWQTFISATCLDMFYMCCTLHTSLPLGINHKYTHISFEIIFGILAIIHSPRLLLLSPHPCGPLLPSSLLFISSFFRKLSFSFFAA